MLCVELVAAAAGSARKRCANPSRTCCCRTAGAARLPHAPCDCARCSSSDATAARRRAAPCGPLRSIERGRVRKI